MTENKFVSAFIAAIVAVTALVAMAGCSDGDDRDADRPTPLQPLIYTEYPDLTPEGAAVREKRLQRQLLEGIVDGSWGRLEEDSGEPLPGLGSEEELGEAIIEALVERDERLWEHIFISGEAYGALVGVGSTAAGEFVDNQIGGSLQSWELFSPEHSSAITGEGFAENLQFETLELGSPRRHDGGAATGDDEIAQYLNNRVVFRHIDFDVTFELPIARIFQIPRRDPAGGESDDEPTPFVLRVGSEIEPDPRFQTLRDVGLHLRPQLMRAEQYPFPLGVGSFWRYRRYDADTGADDEIDPLDQRLDDTADGVAAEELIVEVREVSRYGSIRLVELLSSYDDRDYTRVREWWALTPRRIYMCTEDCREHIDDVDWLLGYFAGRAPLMKFPLSLDEGWDADGQRGESEPLFYVDKRWHEIDTPAGTFSTAFRIVGQGDLGRSDPYSANAEVARYFVPGRGVVRRTLNNSGESDTGLDVVEDLVQYRLMH